MALNVKDTGGAYELPPEGVHVARCIRVIDLGRQPVAFQGKTSLQSKVLLTWELIGEPDETPRMGDGRPFSISRRLTASLAERAALRALLQSWRGKTFSPEELNSFDLKAVAGVYGLANIVHAMKDGNTYANLQSLMSLPKGMPRPTGVNPVSVFDLENPDNGVWEQLGERLQAVILASPEGQAWMNGHPQAPASSAAPQPQGGANAAQSGYSPRPTSQAAQQRARLANAAAATTEVDFDDDILF